MARPREFDEKAVLDGASDVFWTKGYGAASTRDLAARTGLTPSSMYAAFGDKRGLFRSALDHYLERLRTKMSHLEQSLSPAHAITGFFEDTIERCLCDRLQRGCMLVNSALEATPDDPEFRDAIARELRLIERFFRERFVAGQARGEVPSSHSADDAARQLLALLVGVRVLARVCPDRALLTGSVRQALELLDLPVLESAAPIPKSTRRGQRATRSSKKGSTHD
jgi:TetR/AcrR family transcriptional repressor of nem operon